MQNANSKILGLFSNFLAHKTSLADFQEQVALAHWDVEQVAPKMSKLVYRATGKLSEFSRGYRTEQSLRDELAIALTSEEESLELADNKRNN